MKYLSRQFKQILLISCLLFWAGALLAQQKSAKPSRELKNFTKAAAKANLTFTLPEGFKELAHTEGLSYDFGIGTLEQDFEVWFKVIPQTEATSDSAYVEIGKNEAKNLAGEADFLTRGMPDRVLTDYGADAGRVYMFSLPDGLATSHYKYALLITLQKTHKGMVMAVCFTNEKGPDFFRKINKARYSIKFKG